MVVVIVMFISWQMMDGDIAVVFVLKIKFMARRCVALYVHECSICTNSSIHVYKVIVSKQSIVSNQAIVSK